LCDVWQPPDGVPGSGLAFIYFHSSAWYLLDKDFGTRPFFRHLAQQGHVVMDVAYRLAPEADMTGMLGDIKRAVVWMKDNAARLMVNPQRVVVGGGSAGGHLSKDDLITPVKATRIIFEKLCAAGVPVLMAVYPQTDHAFDLMLPRLSLPAQAALYEIDHFLAVLA
jgi:acetyl esterase/lipase